MMSVLFLFPVPASQLPSMSPEYWKWGFKNWTPSVTMRSKTGKILHRFFNLAHNNRLQRHLLNLQLIAFCAAFNPYTWKERLISSNTSDTSDSDSSSIRRSKNKNKENSKRQAQSQQTQTIFESFHSTQRYSIPISDASPNFLCVCSPRNPNARWTFDPKPEITIKNEVTVYEAEPWYDDYQPFWLELFWKNIL